jgi:phosphoglycerate dehydrogenase-like enzyme
MLTVAFAGAFAAHFEAPVRAVIEPGCVLIADDEDAILARLSAVDVLVSMTFDRRMAAAAPRLKLVQVPGAGLDRVDRGALPAGVWLANAYGHEAGIAEYAIGALLALARSFVRLDGALRRGAWESQWAVDAPAPAPWRELAGRTLGILGYGRIGQALARRARAFDMEVRAIRREPSRSAGDGLAQVGGPQELDDLLRGADCLAVAAPLSEATRGLLGARELALLKPGALLVNVGRAEIVDEDALYEALAAGRIAGAALDVWYRYPSAPGPAWPARRPFHELPNVLMTPHVSGWTDGMMAARTRVIVGNVERAARGEPPLDLVATGA